MVENYYRKVLGAARAGPHTLAADVMVARLRRARAAAAAAAAEEEAAALERRVDDAASDAELANAELMIERLSAVARSALALTRGAGGGGEEAKGK